MHIDRRRTEYANDRLRHRSNARGGNRATRPHRCSGPRPRDFRSVGRMPRRHDPLARAAGVGDESRAALHRRSLQHRSHRFRRARDRRRPTPPGCSMSTCPSPTREASGALRLVANKAHPAVEQLLGTEHVEQRQLIESVLRWDVARTVIERALDQPRFVEGYGEFAPETVGGVAQRLLQLHLPGCRCRRVGGHAPACSRATRRVAARPTSDVEAGMTEPPRLSRTRALELQRSVVLLSPQQARDEARGRANETGVADHRLVDNLRGIADLHGWPNPIDRITGERVDRAWSHALIQQMDITPVVAAEETRVELPCSWSRCRTWCVGASRIRGRALRRRGRPHLRAVVVARLRARRRA